MLRSLVHPGDVLGGKYRVERVIGEGGMGLVVAAVHVARGDRVALKLLNPTSAGSPVGLARFDREARAASRVKSENVARVLDVGVTGFGAPFLVMEYLAGNDLASLLEGAGPIPIDEAAVYVLQACEGVAVAHEHGIIHRDLKPANLFLTTGAGGAPCVKVLDFGLSKLSADPGTMSVTNACTILGTPLYMAPEQFASPCDVDARADVWALGICLYELLTGKVPFHEQNIHRQYALLITKSPTPPSELRPELPRALDEVVLRCLRRDPAERFASVRELATALSNALPTGARSRVASLTPEALRERASRISTMRPVMARRPESVGEARRNTTSRLILPLRNLPGGMLAWVATLVAVMAITAVFLVHGSAALGEPTPIVLYAPSPAKMHKTVASITPVAAAGADARPSARTAAEPPTPREAPAAGATPSASPSKGRAGGSRKGGSAAGRGGAPSSHARDHVRRKQ